MEPSQWPAQFSPPDIFDRLHLFILGEKDIDDILAIEQVSFSEPWSKDLFAMEFSTPLSLGIGARMGNERGLLTGYLFLWFIMDEVQIHTIATHPALRGQQIASCLLSVGLQLARQKEAKWASLEVRPSNLAAKKLYQKFGFYEVGRRPGYYSSPREDAVLMNANL